MVTKTVYGGRPHTSIAIFARESGLYWLDGNRVDAPYVLEYLAASLRIAAYEMDAKAFIERAARTAYKAFRYAHPFPKTGG